eukprot:jgi/Chlat1/5882/Chrsp4S06242
MGVWEVVLVGACWGCTNPLIKRGAARARLRASKQQQQQQSAVGVQLLGDWALYLTTWQYLVPFLVNLAGSVGFLWALSRSSVSVAAPVANASAFAFTAAVGALLGEDLNLAYEVLHAQSLMKLLGIEYESYRCKCQSFAAAVTHHFSHRRHPGDSVGRTWRQFVFKRSHSLTLVT